MTPAPELCPPHLPVEIFKDWLEEHYQGDAPFDREAAYLRWLDESKTFERLGECMCLALADSIGNSGEWGTQRIRDHYDWRNSLRVGGMQWEPANFTRLCASFGVPAVFVQVGVPNWDANEARRIVTGIMPGLTVFGPPSPALAAAVLRHCVEHGVHDDASLVAEMERIGPQGMCDCLTCCMRQHMNNVTGAKTVRLRVGAAGEWHIETGV